MLIEVSPLKVYTDGEPSSVLFVPFPRVKEIVEGEIAEAEDHIRNRNATAGNVEMWANHKRGAESILRLLWEEFEEE